MSGVIEGETDLRAVPWLVGGLALVLAGGCQSLGEIDRPPPTLPESVQACGRLPGIDPTFYAYLYYKGTASQVYRAGVPEVTASTLDALCELGYRAVHVQEEAGRVRIDAKTLDGRPAAMTIRSQYGMAKLTVRIGALGDEPVSKTLIERVAFYSGTLPPVMIPLEPALARRLALRPRPAAAGTSPITIPPATPEGSTTAIPIEPPPPAAGASESPFQPPTEDTSTMSPLAEPG